MSNYIASDSELTSVANAIRTKGGTSAQLAFPAGFVSAIEDIETGGGYSLSAVFTQGDTFVFSTDDLDDLRDRLVVTAHYSDNTSEVITEYSLSGTLTAGASIITVEALDISTTFTANVTEAVDVSPSISGTWTASHSSVTIVKNTTDKSLLVYTTSNGTYRSAYFSMTFEEGYGYQFSADVEYFSGTAKLCFGNSSNTMYNTSENITESGHFVTRGVLSESSNFTVSGSVRFYVTWSSSASGRAVFRNIKLIKYSTATPADALNLLMGGENA